MITIPQLVLTGYYLYAADDKTRNEYLELPMWRRQLFMNVKIGDVWVPFPRAFAPGYIFGALPEQIMVHEYGGYKPEPKNAWAEMVKGAANSVSPIFDWSKAINPLVKSMIENITNYSFFAEHPIYSPDKANLPASERSNTYTSETAKILGDVFNFSPAMIDETVQNMTGNLGKYFVQASDKAISTVRGLEGKPVSEKPSSLSDTPSVNGFVERDPAGANSGSVQEFYEHYDNVSQIHNQLKDLDGKEASDFEKANRTDLAQFEAFKAAHKEISALQKENREVYGSTTMNGDQKSARMQRINDQITAVARQANMGYANTTKRGK
jgi:hypothetical protein